MDRESYLDALAASMEPAPASARVYSDDEIATLTRMWRGGGDSATWARLELQRAGRDPEVLGHTS